MTTSAPTPPHEGPRNVGVLLQLLEEGQFLVDASTQFHDLVRAIGQLAESSGAGVKGEFVIKLKVTAIDADRVTIDADLTVKKPKARRGKSWLWFTKGGNLAGENPRQPSLFPREVPSPAPAAPREAGAHDAPVRGV